MLSAGFVRFLDAEIIDPQGPSDHEIGFMSDGVIHLMMVLYTISQTGDTGLALAADKLQIFIEFNVDYAVSNLLELKVGRFSPYRLQGVVLSLVEPDSGERKVYERVGRVYLIPGQEKLDHKSAIYNFSGAATKSCNSTQAPWNPASQDVGKWS